MKKLFRILIITVFIGNPILLLTNSCHEEESNKQTLPEISTKNVTGITPLSAVCGGKITSTGGSAVISRGICWCLGPSPTISDQKIADSSGNDQFELTITGLMPNTTYFVRAYAINMVGTAYGDIKVFKTQNGILDIDGNVYHAVTIGTQTRSKIIK